MKDATIRARRSLQPGASPADRTTAGKAAIPKQAATSLDKATAKGAFVKSADRTLDLLELISSAPYQLNFSQIVAQLGVPKSSLSQLLGNLLARGYVVRENQRGSFGLGPKLVALARAAEASTPFRQILHAAIERLRDRLNETVAYYERRGDEVEIVDRLETRHALVYTLVIGDRAPLYAISPGKIELAYMSDADVDAYIARTELRRFGPKTIMEPDDLRREIDRVRKEGIAFAGEELAAGICGMAVPVVDNGRLLGSLNVAVPVVRFSRDLEAEIRARLPRIAEEIGHALSRRSAPES